MRTISIAEFVTLVARTDWQRDQDVEVLERGSRQVGDSLDLINIPHVRGSASITSRLDDIVITYSEGFEYDEYSRESFSTDTEGMDEVWSVWGVLVVDEDGDELDANELADYLEWEFSGIDYSMLEIDKTIDIDKVDEDSDMETFTLEIDNAPNLRFTGDQVASTSSPEDGGRWTEIALYKTKSGKYICHQVGRSKWVGEHDRYSGKVCETPEEIIEFFGQRWLAKELYDLAGIDNTIEVE